VHRNIRGDKIHIAIMIREKLATNITMEVNAATSRMISVIYALLTRYVSYLFYFCSRVNRNINKFHHHVFNADGPTNKPRQMRRRKPEMGRNSWLIKGPR
jgi:hypothetical protein